MTAITRNRELSQFGSFIYVDDSNQNVAITTDSSRFVGIGSTIPTSKLDVEGDVSVSGVVTASNFSGELIGTASLASGIVSTTNLSTSGIITASAFYINDALLVNAEISTWSHTGATGIANTVYRTGNVGIGTSLGINEKLVVNGNISANRVTSTVATGTAPFVVSSSTLVTNLNADFLRGKSSPSGDIVGTNDSQTLTNKTLTTPSITTPSVTNGISFNGSTSGSTILRPSASSSGTLTLPAETGTLISTASVGVVTTGNIFNGTILNEDINDSASIAISKLASSTISGVALGNNLNPLTVGSFLSLNSGTTYNGSAGRTISVNASSSNADPANFPIVARNASGDFSAGTITATSFNGNLSGNATTATTATTATSANTVNTTSTSTPGTYYLTFVDSSSSTTGETMRVHSEITYNPDTGTLTTADINSTSDINLKKNINPIENALNKVQELNGVSFEWKNNDTKSIGVIAQEVEKIFPELIKEINDKKTVNYNGLVGVLVQAVKELSVEVEELKKKMQ